MLREVTEPTEACRELVEQFFRPHFEIMMDILRDIVPDDTPAHVLHRIGFSIVGQCLYHRVAGEIVVMMIGPEEHGAYYSREQLADHISRVSLAALGCVEPFGARSTLPHAAPSRPAAKPRRVTMTRIAVSHGPIPNEREKTSVRGTRR